MAKKCASACLDTSLKEAILQQIPSGPVHNQVMRIPECKCGGKRAPSEYQQFVGTCLRNKHLKGFDPTALSDCASQWRQQRGQH